MHNIILLSILCVNHYPLLGEVYHGGLAGSRTQFLHDRRNMLEQRFNLFDMQQLRHNIFCMQHQSMVSQNIKAEQHCCAEQLSE